MSAFEVAVRFLLSRYPVIRENLFPPPPGPPPGGRGEYLKLICRGCRPGTLPLLAGRCRLVQSPIYVLSPPSGPPAGGEIKKIPWQEAKVKRCFGG